MVGGHEVGIEPKALGLKAVPIEAGGEELLGRRRMNRIAFIHGGCGVERRTQMGSKKHHIVWIHKVRGDEGKLLCIKALAVHDLVIHRN